MCKGLLETINRDSPESHAPPEGSAAQCRAAQLTELSRDVVSGVKLEIQDVLWRQGLRLQGARWVLFDQIHARFNCRGMDETATL